MDEETVDDARESGVLASRSSSRHTIRVTLASCLNASSAGTLLAFSLYAPTLQTALHYTQTKMALIGAAAVAGMYIGGPVWGWTTSVRRGAERTSLGGGVLFALAYLSAEHFYRTAEDAETSTASALVWVVLFLVMGLATGAQFFAAVTSVAKSTGPKWRGTVLSLPITSFGLSAFFVSTWTRLFLTSHGGLELAALFRALAIFTAIVGLIGFFTLGNDRPADAERLDEESPLLAERTQTSVGDFMRDPTAWALALALLVATGTSESIVNVIGFIVRSMRPTVAGAAASQTLHEQSKNVQIISISNAASRLLIGVLSDWSFARFRIPRLAWLAAASALLCLSFLFCAYALQDWTFLWLLSLCAGTAYGIWFCLSPTVVSMIWGTKAFGMTWGIMANAPAIGSVSFTFLFSMLYDVQRNRQDAAGAGAELDICLGPECFRAWMITSASSLGLTFALLAWLYRHPRWSGKI